MKVETIKEQDEQIEATDINAVEQHTSLELSFSGPIPSAQILSEYDKIIPGAAERIISMIEAEVMHRRSIEIDIFKKHVKTVIWGQLLGFIIGLIGIFAGSYIILKGSEIPGAIIGLASLTSIMATFLTTKYRISTSDSEEGKGGSR